MGGEVRKVRWIGRNGAPDRFVMLPGQQGLWIELKAPGQRCRPHQIREHVRMQNMGQRVEVVDSLEGVPEPISDLHLGLRPRCWWHQLSADA